MSLFHSLLSAGGFDASYQAVLNRATALGYTKPSSAQQIKQNQLVLNLKSSGIWSLLDRLSVFATDGDSNFATLNWISPTLYQASKVNSPTFTTNVGFNGNGTTSYLDSGFNLSTNGVNYALNAASFGGDVAGVFSSGAICGCNDGAQQTIIYHTGTNPAIRVNQVVQDVMINSNPDTGFFFAERTTSGAINGEMNSTTGSGVPSSSARPSRNLYLLAYNNNGSAGLLANSAVQLKFHWIGGAFDQSVMKTHWNTYFNSL